MLQSEAHPTLSPSPLRARPPARAVRRRPPSRPRHAAHVCAWACTPLRLKFWAPQRKPRVGRSGDRTRVLAALATLDPRCAPPAVTDVRLVHEAAPCEERGGGRFLVGDVHANGRHRGWFGFLRLIQGCMQRNQPAQCLRPRVPTAARSWRYLLIRPVKDGTRESHLPISLRGRESSNAEGDCDRQAHWTCPANAQHSQHAIT